MLSLPKSLTDIRKKIMQSPSIKKICHTHSLSHQDFGNFELARPPDTDLEKDTDSEKSTDLEKAFYLIPTEVALLASMKCIEGWFVKFLQ